MASATFSSRTRWRDKLAKEQEPKIIPVPPKWRSRYGDGTMLIPRPLDVDALIRKVPKGRLLAQSNMRAELARDGGADHACPLCTGIFVRIAAEAAEEAAADGVKRITPWWRVVRDDGTLLEKCPGGGTEQRRRLEEEGHRIEGKGKRLRVVGFRSR